MPIAERLAPRLQRLAEQRLRGGEVALGLQQQAEVVDGSVRVRMTTAERLVLPLQRLAVQQLSGGEVALGLQQPAEVVDALSLLRARNRGYYVGTPRNALRESRNRHVMGLLRARNRFRIGFVTTWHVMGT